MYFIIIHFINFEYFLSVNILLYKGKQEVPVLGGQKIVTG